MFRADTAAAALFSSDHRLLLMRIANGEKTATASIPSIFFGSENTCSCTQYTGGSAWGVCQHRDRSLLPPMLSSSSASICCSARDYRAWDV
jgi:hypothetical protein